jgi:hypothetical protein
MARPEATPPMQTLRNPTKSDTFADATTYNDHYVKYDHSYPQICVYFIAKSRDMHNQMWISSTFGLWITRSGGLPAKPVQRMHEGQMVLFPYTCRYPKGYRYAINLPADRTHSLLVERSFGVKLMPQTYT